ncbi:HET-domain-containing protein, partial [Cadophora sp. DSE1049]
QSWIQECMKNHTKCQTEDVPMLPKRVIDIGTSHDDTIKLHETNEQRGYYVALSHQWGKTSLLTTRTTTLNTRKSQIPWPSLSQTFQDSITLTRLLGIRYLWIDSLCIIQDDPVDWEIESAKMADVYEKSYVTISANTSTGILLGPSITRKYQSQQLETVEMNGTAVPLRAWCFQERFLATRILHFTDSEVVFECLSGCDCECGGVLNEKYLKSRFASFMSRSGKPRGKYEMSMWDGWTAIVNQYVRKDITYPIDILPALAGMASRVDCDELGRYVAGLWEKNLAQGIFWFAHVSSCDGVGNSTAPSFSWASLAGTTRANEVTWPYSLEEGEAKGLFDIVEVVCDVGTHNPYGVVTRGSLHLKGYLLDVTLKAQKGPAPFNCVIRCGDLEQGARMFMDRVILSDLTVERNLVCFFGFQRNEHSNPRNRTDHEADFCVLLLERLEEGIYRRFGCAPFLVLDVSWLEKAKYQEFSLV